MFWPRSLLALAACATALAACSDDDGPLDPSSAANARVDHASLPLASGRWSGERSLAVGGTTLLARLEQPVRAQHAGGAPTVVFISGVDAELTDWSVIQPAVATLGAPAFAYDRAGVGRSGAHTGPRPSSVIADELREALRVAGLRPPYVLVAHSLGGFHARVFAQRFPRDVAGLVLVDASLEQRFAFLNPTFDEIIAGTMRHPGAAAEVLARPQTLAEVAATRFPQVPTALISNLTPAEGETTETKAEDFAMHAAWLDGLAVTSHRTTLVGHQVPLAAPHEVIDAVRWVLERARTGR